MLKYLMIIGGLLLVIGAILWYFDKSSLNYNNPLDFSFKKGNTQVYFPLGTSILISLVLSVIVYLFKGK